MPQPVELHYWPTPNGWKVSIALEEMGLPYTVVPVNIGAGDQFKPDFLTLSPNNRMPAIVDPEGPDGESISVFESGAILQYLGRKTGRFYPRDERGRVETDQWVFWQMANLGPVAGQANHFRNYAKAMVDDPAQLSYAANRFTNELNRLLGVMERRLGDRDYLAGDYSIADMLSFPWVLAAVRLIPEILDAFPRVAPWRDRIAARPAVIRGLAVGEDLRKNQPQLGDKEAADQRRILFGQTAGSVAAAADAQAKG
ncbi:MAG: glutathione S-transferase N-terminal domain-containing protein [Hyphomonadaceae bacterium]